jgi:hypothetical protein
VIASRIRRVSCIGFGACVVLFALHAACVREVIEVESRHLPPILITSALEGNIEPCGCGGNFSGGLEDSTRSIAAARRYGDLWVDMGQAIGGGPLKRFVLTEVLAAWRDAQVDCICLGADELGFVEEIARATNVPIVCANVRHRALRTHWDVGGLRFSSVVSPELAGDVDASSARTALQSIIADADAAGKLPVVGLHAREPERRELLTLLRSCSTRFVVFDACSTTSSAQGVAHYGAGLVIRGRGRGRDFAKIDWDLADDRYWALVEFLDARKTDSGTVAHRYRARVAAAVADNEALTEAYVGSSRCGACHQEEYERWNKTMHAHSMRSLQTAGLAARPDCYVCHITSASTLPTSTLSQLPAPAAEPLAHVGCESCHGPGAAHVESRAALPVRPSASCRSCHVGKFADGFDYDRMIRSAGCQPR